MRPVFAVVSALALVMASGVGAGARADVILNVGVASPWQDTGIDIPNNSLLILTTDPTHRVIFGFGGSTGTRTITADGIGDEGVPPGHNGTGFIGPNGALPNEVSLTLIGKIGGTTAIGTGIPLPVDDPAKGDGFVGSSFDHLVASGGRLFLGFNDDIFFDNSGSFQVTVRIVPAQSPTPTTIPEPASLLVFGAGCVGLLSYRWKRRKLTT